MSRAGKSKAGNSPLIFNFSPALSSRNQEESQTSVAHELVKRSASSPTLLVGQTRLGRCWQKKSVKNRPAFSNMMSSVLQRNVERKAHALQSAGEGIVDGGMAESAHSPTSPVGDRELQDPTIINTTSPSGSNPATRRRKTSRTISHGRAGDLNIMEDPTSQSGQTHQHSPAGHLERSASEIVLSSASLPRFNPDDSPTRPRMALHRPRSEQFLGKLLRRNSNGGRGRSASLSRTMSGEYEDSLDLPASDGEDVPDCCGVAEGTVRPDWMIEGSLSPCNLPLPQSPTCPTMFGSRSLSLSCDDLYSRSQSFGGMSRSRTSSVDYDRRDWWDHDNDYSPSQSPVSRSESPWMDSPWSSPPVSGDECSGTDETDFAGPAVLLRRRPKKSRKRNAQTIAGDLFYGDSKPRVMLYSNLKFQELTSTPVLEVSQVSSTLVQ